jgi:hypothetical protein
MTIGIVLLHVGLVVVTFVLMLNGYLRGAAKAKTDAILSLMWIGLLGLSLLLFGWRSALIALVLSFVYSRAAVTPARTVARRMLGYRTALTTVDAQVDFSVEGLLRGNEDDNRRVVQIAKRPRIAHVLSAHGLTP